MTPSWPWSTVAAEERAHVRVLVGLGVAVFVTHWLFLPPDWLWLDVPYCLAGALGVVAAGAGFRGFGPSAGVLATSAPGLALALRSEYWTFHFGCHETAGPAGGCTLPPADSGRYAAQMLGLSVLFVLVVCTVGYGVGAGLRRLVGDGG